jgi:hypothetical protein
MEKLNSYITLILYAQYALAAPPIFTYLLFVDGSYIYPWFNCCIHSAPRTEWRLQEKTQSLNNKYLITVKEIRLKPLLQYEECRLLGCGAV